MAARRRSSKLLAAAESSDEEPFACNKRKATELAAGSSADAELQPQRIRAAAEPTAMSATPPLPNSGDDELPRIKERRRLSNLAANDPRRHLLPTVMEPKDKHTSEFVSSPTDKALVRAVARSVVAVCSVALDDGEVVDTCTGIVVGWSNEKTRTNQKPARILTSFDVLREPRSSYLRIRLANGTTLQGQVLFVNEHYNIVLLETKPSQAADDLSSLPLQLPSFGSNPSYGQEVFALARGKESNLMARHGTILWFDEPDCFQRNHHMFLSCELPACGTGGPVVDHDGNVAGMAFDTGTDDSHPTAILAASTILTCVEMWMKFDRIARPAHGLRLRTVEMLEVSLQEMMSLDHDIESGYIVDRVASGSAAESLGVRYGDVIVSFDGLRRHTLPQLEDYLLSLGLTFLMQTSTDSTDTIDLKLQVYDPLGRSTRSIILPVEFSDDACV
ncbi:hypothetical protein EJB05_40520, partial [Eragrostis curvula]